MVDIAVQLRNTSVSNSITLAGTSNVFREVQSLNAYLGSVVILLPASKTMLVSAVHPWKALMPTASTAGNVREVMPEVL